MKYDQIGWYPSQSGVWDSSLHEAEAGSGASTGLLVDSNAFANGGEGVIGRQITRPHPTTSVPETAYITGYTNASTVTTSAFASGIEWADGQQYRMATIGNYYTNDFGRYGHGVGWTEYATENFSNPAVPSHLDIHKVWSNMAAYVFEGTTLRLWEKAGTNEGNWTVYPNREPKDLGGCFELGYEHRAGNTHSYKLNFPHPASAPAAGSILQILSIATSVADKVDGTKDRPYRITTEWTTGDGTGSYLRANSVNNFVESMLFG